MRGVLQPSSQNLFFFPSPAVSDALYVPRWQDGLLALEALLQRRKDVDTWTIEDVVSWLGDVGLWSENTEREVRLRPVSSRKHHSPICIA